jgi:hypothetical protein
MPAGVLESRANSIRWPGIRATREQPQDPFGSASIDPTGRQMRCVADAVGGRAGRRLQPGAGGQVHEGGRPGFPHVRCHGSGQPQWLPKLTSIMNRLSSGVAVRTSRSAIRSG